MLKPMEAFRQFFSMIQNSDLTEEEERLMAQVIEEAKEEEE